MTFTLAATVNGAYQISEAVPIASLADALLGEYGLMGYSITTEDIILALIQDMSFYAGWEETQEQRQGNTVLIDQNYKIAVHEWAVLDPVIRSHCDLIQAQRSEAAASLGMERFGLSVSEAMQNYNNAKLEMKKEAFVEPPFTLDFGSL
ncbi:hypothetical protein [Acinetobacter indicus]|uniref:hypothetical protein n=1 Tax=Acinetobacter indicus TaxID=756892 RepID=UPI00209AA1FB|nr:hypothetical protein [Acinetobacter indicus]MCO8088254.1 hypothetical protein [Acinetobacter indicus]